MKKINNIFERHKDWLPRSEKIIAQELEYINEDLASNTLAGLDNVSDSLGLLATCYGINGIVSIGDDVTSGWRDVSKSLMYRYWALRLRSKSFSKTNFLQGVKNIPNLTNQMSNAGCLLAGFIAMDRNDFAAPIANILLGMLTVKGAVDPNYLKQRKFEPFIFWLYSLYAGKDVPAEVETENLGVYQRVVDFWSDASEVALAINDLCEYHLSNSEDNGGKWDPEFKNAPFDLLPLEIQAIYLVRKKLGLEILKPNNPLMSVATAATENLTIVHDEITLKVETVYAGFFGEA